MTLECRMTEQMRQEREACLSCPLPECIPDHPDCALGGDVESRKRKRGHRLCAQCPYGVLIHTADPRVRFYVRCPVYGFNTMGWRLKCSRFHQTLLARRRRSLNAKEVPNDSTGKE